VSKAKVKWTEEDLKNALDKAFNAGSDFAICYFVEENHTPKCPDFYEWYKAMQFSENFE